MLTRAERWKPEHRMKLRASVVVLLIVFSSAPALAQSEQSNIKATPTNDSSVPLLGDIMNAVQTRHMKLWFAGKAFNWELATYELRLGPGSRSLRSLVRDDRNTTARRGFNFQTAKRIASASGYPVRRSGAIDYQRLWNTGSSAFADDDNGMRHSPRPACGERSRASCERVRGMLDRLELEDGPLT